MTKPKVADPLAEAREEGSQHEARKDRLIAALAEYLVKDQAQKSIELAKSPAAIEWAKIRNLTSVRGWATVDEAIDALTRDLA